MTKNFEYHPAANWYPLMDGAEYEELKASIAKDGVLSDVVLCEGKILDGRNRHRACLELRLSCPTTQWDGECGDPYKYVVAMNSTRRHLTTVQLAEIGVLYRERFTEPAAERKAAGQEKGGQEHFKGRGRGKDACGSAEPQAIATPIDHTKGGRASQEAAKAVGTSRGSIDRLRLVKSKGSENLQSAVKAEEISLRPAATLATNFPKSQQDEILEGGPTAVKAAIETIAAAKLQEVSAACQLPPGRKRVWGVLRAHEAINCLCQIPRSDPQRKDGFKLVKTWMLRNP